MNQQEKQAEAKKRIDTLVDWYKDRPLPKCPFQLNNWATVNDVSRMVAANIKRMLAGHYTSTVVRTSYILLIELKRYIEKHEGGTGNFESGGSQKSADLKSTQPDKR